MSPGFSVQSWYAPICGSLFSVFDIAFKLLGISKTVFRVTTKTMPKTKSRPKDNGLNSADWSLFYLPGTFILLANIAALADISMGLIKNEESPNHCDKKGGSGLEEVCGFIFVATLFLPFLKGLFEKEKYGIPLSTFLKAAFLEFCLLFSPWESSIVIWVCYATTHD